VGIDQLAAGAPDERGALERLALEIQRTLDHFDRQFRHIAVAKLVIGPTPQPTHVAESLRERFDIQVQEADLREVLDFADGPQPETQWRLLHHFGAALRQEAEAAA
jgi:MSHA biogenesis protein MshI